MVGGHRGVVGARAWDREGRNLKRKAPDSELEPINPIYYDYGRFLLRSSAKPPAPATVTPALRTQPIFFAPGVVSPRIRLLDFAKFLIF